MKFTSLLSSAAALAASFFPAATALQAKDLTPPVQVRIELDRDRLAAEAEETAIVKVRLDGARRLAPENRPPINLALVIDRSGSMSGDKIRHAREAALAAISRLGPDDLVSLIAYDSDVQTLVPACRVGTGEHLVRAIQGLEVGGNTALFAGVSQGASEVRKNSEDTRYSDRVILLSDGMANVGPSSPDELARLGAALMKEGISVSTIGLGLGFNEDLMTRLAQRSDGNTYFVESSVDLPRIFQAELGDVLNIVARRVVVEVVFPEGVRPRNLIGREGRVDGQKVSLELNQLYGGQEKFALIEVQVAPRAAGSELRIAEARVRYEDAVAQKTASASASRTVTFTSRRDEVVRSANFAVQADYARNVLAEAKDRAVTLADANRKEEAAAQLREKAEALRAMAAPYGNASVAAVASESMDEAEALRRDGMDNARRKTYRAESVQVKTQQSSR